jgi:hypothetical protein
MATLGALIFMATESGGAAVLNRADHPQMLPAQPASTLFDESSAATAQNIGHLQGWPGHLFSGFRDRFTSAGADTGRASSGLGTACR